MNNVSQKKELTKKTKKIILHVTKEFYNILLLQDNEIIEYHQERKDAEHIVGDIVLGRVKKVVSSVNAVFVDIGQSKDAFLHYSDLSPGVHSMINFVQETGKKKVAGDLTVLALSPLTQKEGKISDILKEGQKLVVQIVKEAIHSKGLRLSSVISLPSRYLILLPFGNDVIVSKKIRSTKERTRLFNLISSIKPNNFTVIARTAADKKDVASLNRNLENLRKKWEDGMALLPKAKVGQKLISELRATASIAQEILDEHFDKIIVDDKKTYEEIKAYTEAILPERKKVVYLYQGSRSIFQYLGLQKKLDALFGTIVRIRGGGYIIIEYTEALCTIDVNTGSTSVEDTSQENVALHVNLNAVKEIAHQIRLRAIGGIIVVDFVGMNDPKSKKMVYKAMKDSLKDDPAKTEVLPLSKFCLMQITRSRVRSATTRENDEACPTCNGSGKIQPSVALVDLLENQLKLLVSQHKLEGMTVCVHPYFHAYLHQGFLAKKWAWLVEYWQKIRIVEDDTLAITDYRILNKEDNVVSTNPKLKQSQRLKKSQGN